MMQLQKILCTNCGAAIDWDGSYSKTIKCDYCGITFMPVATGLENLWLMTDLVARARYEFEGNLDKLEQDIRFEVMRGQDWSTLDKAFVIEIKRLLAAGLIRQLATFWSSSPHPSVYRVLADAEIFLNGTKIPIKKDDDLVWACPMTRDRFDLDLPVLTGNFNDQKMRLLCGEMKNAMLGRMK